MFLNDLENDLIAFTSNQSTVDEDFAVWHNIKMKHLNNHAPIKIKGVKSKLLPDWFSPEITHMQKRRNNAKKLKHWTDYKIRPSNLFVKPNENTFPIPLKILKILKQFGIICVQLITKRKQR